MHNSYLVTEAGEGGGWGRVGRGVEEGGRGRGGGSVKEGSWLARPVSATILFRVKMVIAQRVGWVFPSLSETYFSVGMIV